MIEVVVVTKKNIMIFNVFQCVEKKKIPGFINNLHVKPGEFIDEYLLLNFSLLFSNLRFNLTENIVLNVVMTSLNVIR